MQMKSPRIRRMSPVVLLAMLSFFFQPGLAAGAQILSTDKEIYNQGEMIRVNFSNSPGNEGDWICIVPAGSPDTEGGDYKYMPKGVAQGSLVFDPPSPGKYEARAYYNYSRNGYVVSGRYAFSVVSTPEGDAAMAARMARKVDPGNPMEATLAPDKGMVYIFREALFASSSFDVEMKANGNMVALIRNSSYFPLEVPAGNVKFTPGFIISKGDKSSRRATIFTSESESRIESARECEATIDVKAGHVYYLRLKMVPMPVWVLFLDQVPHEEGANIIKSYKLTRIEK